MVMQDHLPIVTISPAGLKFIQYFESCRLTPYTDTSGLWTIGWGQRITEVYAMKMHNGITQMAADALFQDAVKNVTDNLSSCPLNGLSQPQQDAITSLAYNIGVRGLQDSTIYKNITIRNIDVSPWLWFIKDEKGNVDQGLVRRRRLELRLFIYGDYSTSS
jgi:GH24 family phage-related lysozyme (muramidase)